MYTDKEKERKLRIKNQLKDMVVNLTEDEKDALEEYLA